MRSLLSAISLAALIAAGSFPAQAQLSVNAIPPPADETDVTGAITGPVSTYFQMAPVQGNGNSATVVTQRRLPLDGRQLRLEGEMASREMPLYVRPEQVSEPARIRIRYINAVTVMPEASRMTITVNDTDLREASIEATTEHGNIEVDIPAGLLEAGYNAIKISVQQRHRVDCSIEAVDELWTQIDPAASGVYFTSSNDQISRIADLPALPLDAEGAAPINIVLAQGTDTLAVDRAIRAAQAIAVRAKFAKPRITFSKEIGNTPGIQLIVGSNAELRSRGFEINTLGDNVLALSGRAGGPIRAIISGATVDDIDMSISRLPTYQTGEADTGSTAGLRAWNAQKGHKLDSDTSISLREMGVPSQEFNGHLFRLNFDVVLPADFYPADNGKATLFLDATYAPGLLTTNEAIVRINGKVVGASRLTRSGGETIELRPIETSLRALQPGYNNVTLEVRTATEGDKDCNPLSALEPRKRLVVTDQTNFKVPRIARVSHLPNMGATASTGFPFVANAAPLSLYLPKPDLPSLGAAATFLARTAVSAGRPVDARISLAPPSPTTANALIVGSISDIPTNLIEHFGIQKDALPATWIKRAAGAAAPAQPVQQPAQPVRPAIPQPMDKISKAPVDPDAVLISNASFKEPMPGAKPQSGSELPGTLGATPASETDINRLMHGVSGFLQRTVGYSNEQLSFLNGGKTNFNVTRTAKIVVAQQQSPAGSKATWMLLMAPDGATLQRETTSLSSQHAWMQLAGRAVAFDPAVSEMSVWPVSNSYYYALQDRTFQNITLFAAGWLSNNVQYYILVILALCAMFGLFTRKILNRVGVQP